MLSRKCRPAFGNSSLVLSLAAAVAVAGWCVGPAVGLAQNQGEKPRASSKAQGISDAEVVESMRKGIDYLLKNKKGDNWESGQKWPKDGQVGGETSLVVYALLHAHQSLKDLRDANDLQDPIVAQTAERSPEMKGPIEYLSKLTPVETYTAGLQASALALTTKRPDEKPGEGTMPGLLAARDYLMGAMGADGGYAYTYLGKGAGGLDEAWEKYFAAFLANDKKEMEDSRKALNEKAKGLGKAFGGVDMAIQSLVRAIRERAAVAKEAKDANGMKKADLEYRELSRISGELPRGSGSDYGKAITEARKKLADAEKRLATGATKDVDKKDKDGKTMKDAKGNTLKEKVPMTKEELQQGVENARKSLANAEFEAKNRFDPIGDLSNAQYGTLGAWALADYGIEIPTQYWPVQDRFWRLLQKSSGSWAYSASETTNSGAKSTMGLAGIASLFITREFVDTDIRLVPKPDKNIELGLAWLNKQYRPSTDLYYMYGVERIGLASGLKFFGTEDWYRSGAAKIISSQKGDGSWKYHDSETVGTAYGLLFLARGRNPVVFNKLEYAGPWDARPRDSANVTRWISKGLERPLNWQTVNLQVDPELWLDSPVLLITGSQDPKFKPEDIAKLRLFVEAGGTIFSTTDGGEKDGKAFSEAMQKVAVQISDKKYEMQAVDTNHPIFTSELWRPVKAGPSDPIPKMLRLSNGVRDFWFHSLDDLGASWHGRREARVNQFIVPANIGFYATGRERMRSKLITLAVVPSTEKATRTIEVARLDHVGNSDPEPGAWRRMVKIAQADFKTELKVSNVKFAELDPKKYKLAHMTGTTRFTLNAADVAALRAYIEGGGLLFVDSAGGSADFTDSFMSAMKLAFPDSPPQPMGPDHPIVAGSVSDGEDVTSIKMRKYAILKLGARATAPKLDTITVKGKLAVVFSPYDIASGFLGTTSWGNVGYSPESAQDIARNILLYAIDPTASKPAASGKTPDENATAAK